MSGIGYVVAAAQLGLSAIKVKPKRKIGAFTATVTLEETHEDTLEITEHPVEQGAILADHAYKLPAKVTIKCAWSNSPAKSGLIDGAIGAIKGTIAGLSSVLSGNSPSQVRDVYEKLLKLQASATPFDILTGKRKYSDMLIKSLSVTTDKTSENLLMVTAVCHQVIIVKTSVASVAAAPAKQADPKKTASPVKTGLQQLQSGSLFSAVKAGAGFVKKGDALVTDVRSIIT